MIHIYYHIYAIDGVENIINEQINLIKSNFKFEYILNIGVSVASDYKKLDKLITQFPEIKVIKQNSDEFTTLDLLEKDKKEFGDNDFILYFHTKGASRQSHKEYDPNIISWRKIMNYFNIEKFEDVFEKLDDINFNTYGILLCADFYRGNFWWSTSKYIKSIDLTSYKRKDRYDAEGN